METKAFAPFGEQIGTKLSFLYNYNDVIKCTFKFGGMRHMKWLTFFYEP